MKKNLNLILLIIWMLFIFIMSSFDGDISGNQSNFIVNIISYILNIKNIELLRLIIRKLAHFTEYFILGILTYNYLKDNKRISIPLIICILYAISDEIHQIFISGRSGEIKDILIDTCGSLIGIIFLKKIKK